MRFAALNACCSLRYHIYFPLGSSHSLRLDLTAHAQFCSCDVSNPRISALLQNRGKTETFMPFSTTFRLVSCFSSLPTAKLSHCISIDHKPHKRRKFATRPNSSGALKTKVRERQQSRKSSNEKQNECAPKAQTPSRISFFGRLLGLQGHFQNQSRMHSRRQTVFRGLRPSCD